MTTRSHSPASVPRSFAAEALVVFAVAAGIRLVHLWQVRRAPFVETLLGDARSYDTWARQIAAGDWLGHDVFYQTPLYPYFLGILFSFGRHLGLVRVVQAFIGAGSCVLIAYATRRLFGDRPGLIAGLMLAVYAPAVFFDGLVQKAVVDIFFICLALMLLAGLMADPLRPARWFGVGLTLGALALTRENSLLFVVVVPAWLWLHHRHLGALRIKFTALLLAGAAAVLVPVGLRNRVVGGEFHLTTAQFGPNFYIGNGPPAHGGYVALRPGRGTAEFERVDATELAEQATGFKLSPKEVSSYWTGRTLAWIRSHPMQWLALEGRKFWLAWNATEMMDTESQEAYEEWSTVLRLLAGIAHLGLLAPLAVLGVWVTWTERRRLWLLYALLGTYTVSVLAFFVLARYRYPLVPFLIIFAAVGVTRAREFLAAARPAERIACAALVAGAAVFCNWPSIFRPIDMRAQTYTNLGERLLADGHLEGASAAFQRAVELRPDDPARQTTLGTLLIKQGQLDPAIEHLSEAVRLNPASPDAEFNLAVALNNKKRYQEAIDHYRAVLRRRPYPAEAESNLSIAETNLGGGLMAEGDIDRAIELFRDAVRLAPQSVDAHYNLGTALVVRGSVDEAVQHLSEAVRIDPSQVSAHYELANAHRAQQRLDLAVAEYREAIRLSPDFVDAHNNLGITLGSMGRGKEAADEFRAALKINPEYEAARTNLQILTQSHRR